VNSPSGVRGGYGSIFQRFDIPKVPYLNLSLTLTLRPTHIIPKVENLRNSEPSRYRAVTVQDRAPADNGFWRILTATERSFLYLYDKIWGGAICISVPHSKFWGTCHPRDLRPCNVGAVRSFCQSTFITSAANCASERRYHLIMMYIPVCSPVCSLQIN